jgi:hypothetical protein
MAEIMKNGPVVLSFEPSYDFMYYESGIYHSKAETSDYSEWVLILYKNRKKLIIQYYVSDGEKIRVINSGCYKTVGEINGEKKVISE